MNKVTLGGIIKNIETIGRYRNFDIECKRKSGNIDILRCVAPLILSDELENGDRVKITGEIQSEHYQCMDANRLRVYVYVKKIEDYSADDNAVWITCETLESVNFRETPLGRLLSETLVKTPRKDNWETYAKVPLLAWWDTAIKISEVQTGTKMYVYGRLQSRNYTKFYDDGTTEERTVTEVSAIHIDVKGE